MSDWVAEVLLMIAAALVFLKPVAPAKPVDLRLLAFGFGLAAAWTLPVMAIYGQFP